MVNCLSIFQIKRILSIFKYSNYFSHYILKWDQFLIFNSKESLSIMQFIQFKVIIWENFVFLKLFIISTISILNFHNVIIIIIIG